MIGLDAVVGTVGKVLDKFVPDKGEQMKIKAELEAELAKVDADIIKTMASVDIAQADINKVEAASSSFFIKGWRSFVGWVCGFGLAWAFVMKPTVDWLVAIFSPTTKLPDLSVGELTVLLANMLGFSAIKTFEKIKGVRYK